MNILLLSFKMTDKVVYLLWHYLHRIKFTVTTQASLRHSAQSDW